VCADVSEPGLRQPLPQVEFPQGVRPIQGAVRPLLPAPLRAQGQEGTQETQ
jgi:hypothetical protein